MSNFIFFYQKMSLFFIIGIILQIWIILFLLIKQILKITLQYRKGKFEVPLKFHWTITS